MMRGFTDWLLLGEDSVGASNVGGGNIAGLGVGKQGEPGVPRRRRKAEIYKSAVRLAQFQQGQMPSQPNRWRRVLQRAKQSAPDINKTTRPRTIGHLLRETQACGYTGGGVCFRCRSAGHCLLAHPIGSA